MLMKKNIFLISFIFLLSFLIYYRATNAYFVADDFFYIQNRNNIHYLSPLTPYFYQPITFLVFYLNFFWAGISYYKYHLFSIILNAFNNILLFYFLSLLIKNKLYSFLITIIAVVYYFSADNIIWINCTNNLICALFYFLTLIFSVKFNLSNNKFHLFLTSFFMLLTLLSREMGVSIFILILCIDFLFFKKNFKNYISTKYPFLFLIFAFYIFIMMLGPSLRYKTLSFNRGNYELEFSLKSIIININWFFFRTFIPCSFGSHFKLPLIIKITLFIRFNYLSIIFVLIMALIVRNKFYYFGVMWIIITASPYLLLNIYYVFNGDRYFYLPHIGLGLILLGFWEHFKKYFLNKKIFSFIKFFVFLFLFLYSALSIYAINQRISWWIKAGETSKKFITTFQKKIKDIPENSIFFIKDIPRWAENAPNKLIALINGSEFALRLFYNKKDILVIPYWEDFGEKNFERFSNIKKDYKHIFFFEYTKNDLIQWQPSKDYLERYQTYLKEVLKR